MPSIIDSFFVALRLDPDSLFVKDAKKVRAESASMKDQLKKDADEAEAHARRTTQAFSPEAIKRQKEAKKQAELEAAARKEKERSDREQLARNKRIAESWTDIGKAALTTMAIIVSAKGITDYMAGVAKQITQVKNAAENAGMSVTDLFTMGNVVAKNGGDPGAARGSLVGLANTMQGWRSGMAIPDKNFMYAFGAVGGDLAKDTPLSLYEKFAAFSAGKSNQRTTQIGQMLGIDEGSIAAARLAGKSMGAQMADMAKFAPTQDEAKALADLNAALVTLTASAGKAGMELAVELAPSVKKVADDLKIILDKLEPFLKPFVHHAGNAAATGADFWKDVASRDWTAAGSDYIKSMKAAIKAVIFPFGVPAPGGSGGGGSVSAADADAAWAAMIHQESGGHQFSGGHVTTSSRGAIGIAQVMPKTGPMAARLAGMRWDPQRYMTDAAYNLALGKAYFLWLLKKFGDISQAMAAYNSGPGTVSAAIRAAHRAHRDGHWGDYMRLFQSPANALETQNYVSGNLAYMNRQGSGTTVHIDTQIVNSRASDAAGIASDIKRHLTNPALVAQSNSGLS